MSAQSPREWEARILDHLIQSGRLSDDQIRPLETPEGSSVTDLWGPRIQRLLDGGLLHAEEITAAMADLMGGDPSLDPDLTDASRGGALVEGAAGNPLLENGQLGSLPGWEEKETLVRQDSAGAPLWQTTARIQPWDPASLIGARIGHVRVVALLGQGGMGQVYEGYDEKLERKVALKCVREEHRLHAKAKARFLREARVLSQLAHPNICRIFDFIEGDAADFLVLELIHGQSLKQAMKQGIGEEPKLEIAETLAGVLVAAHGKGIVHRDLKPDNIMLTGEGQLKVLDFGLARFLHDEVAAFSGPFGNAVDPSVRPIGSEISTPTDPSRAPTAPFAGPSESHESAEVTQQGSVLGTPGYMSPEQALGKAASSASDLYSFGRILQELFIGKMPLPTSDEVPSGAEQARETKATGKLDADLVRLMQRLLSKEPAARPAAADVVEKLAWIRRKPARRRQRRMLIAAVTLLGAISTGLAFQSVRATQAERRAREEASTSKEISNFLVGLFRVSDPREAQGNAITARELLDKGAEKIRRELKDQPMVQARLLNAMGMAYNALGLHQKAQPLLESARQDRERMLGPEHLEVATSLLNLGNLYEDQARYAEAEPLLLRSLEIREKALGPNDLEVAASLNGIGVLFLDQGQFAKAEPIFLRCLRIQEKALGPDHPAVASSLTNLGAVYYKQGNFANAEQDWTRSLQIREKTLGPEDPDVATSLVNLGTLYVHLGQGAKAEPFYLRCLRIQEKSLGPDHPFVATSLLNLGALYLGLGQYAKAKPFFLRSLGIWEKEFGPDHPDVALSLNYLASLYLRQGQAREAEPLYLRCLKIQEKAHGPDHPEVAVAYYNLGCVNAHLGRRRKALSFLQLALRVKGEKPWIQDMGTDPDLASLHGDPAFGHLVAEAGVQGEAGQVPSKTAHKP